jgi:hypothetical protein
MVSSGNKISDGLSAISNQQLANMRINMILLKAKADRSIQYSFPDDTK